MKNISPISKEIKTNQHRNAQTEQQLAQKKTNRLEKILKVDAAETVMQLFQLYFTISEQVHCSTKHNEAGWL